MQSLLEKYKHDVADGVIVKDDAQEKAALALQRQKTISAVAFPAILACIAAIAYLVARYF